VGHSTRELDKFIDLIRHHEIELVIDIRTIPASRRMPHFTKASLERSLAQANIGYLHMPALGGLRRPQPQSVNAGLRNAGFRGYADYMQEETFWKAIDELIVLGASRRTAIMCAEAVPWRCHRSLTSDALTVKGIAVRHITGKAAPAAHGLNPFALVEEGRITYPEPDRLPI
jgi:uncharacterized protein (DUF488 family)